VRNRHFKTIGIERREYYSECLQKTIRKRRKENPFTKAPILKLIPINPGSFEIWQMLNLDRSGIIK